MHLNAFMLDWTFTEFSALKQTLVDNGFAVEPEPGTAHCRVAVPLDRLETFAALVRPDFNARCNYVDVQYPDERLTVLVFQDEVFRITTHAQNEQVRAWAIGIGLPPHQADWPVSF
jgi:hypothetical protein